MTAHKTRRETAKIALRRELELRGYMLKKGKNGFEISDSAGYLIHGNLETLEEAQAFLDELKEGETE